MKYSRGRAPQLEDFLIEDKTPGKEKLFQIVQLKNSKELFDEGSKMKHCVASYARRCKRGDTSIWSLREIKTGGLKPVSLVTIELNCNNKIVQARGSCNRMPKGFEKKLIQRWADKENLATHINN